MTKIITTPYKLQEGGSIEQNWALLNGNFNSIVSDIGDFGPSSSGVGSIANLNILSGKILRFIVQSMDIKDATTATSILPKITLRIDADDLAHQFPDGSALTTQQRSLWYSMIPTISIPIDRDFTDPSFGLTAPYQYLNSRAVVSILNGDSLAHNYWITFASVIYSARPTSQYR